MVAMCAYPTLGGGPLQGGRKDKQHERSPPRGMAGPSQLSPFLSSGKFISKDFSKAGPLYVCPATPPPCPHPVVPGPHTPCEVRRHYSPSEEPGLGPWVLPTSCQLAMPSAEAPTASRAKAGTGVAWLRSRALVPLFWKRHLLVKHSRGVLSAARPPGQKGRRAARTRRH